MSVDARLVVGDGDRLEAVGTVHRSRADGQPIAAARFTVKGEPGILTVQNRDAAVLVEALLDCAYQVVCAAYEQGALVDPARLASLAAELRLRIAERMDGMAAEIREARATLDKALVDCVEAERTVATMFDAKATP